MGSLSKPSVSIIIPAYNEERRLPLAIRDIRGFFDPSQTSIEFIIVIEKSKDRTVELALKAINGDARFRVIANDVQYGKGFAVKTGMLQAQGDIVFFMDADLSTPLAEVGTFLSILMSDPNVDIVIGSRAEAKSQILKKQTWIRQNLGRGFNHLVQAVGIRGIKDTQCGFKAFRRQRLSPSSSDKRSMALLLTSKYYFWPESLASQLSHNLCAGQIPQTQKFESGLILSKC